MQANLRIEMQPLYVGNIVILQDSAVCFMNGIVAVRLPPEARDVHSNQGYVIVPVREEISIGDEIRVRKGNMTYHGRLVHNEGRTVTLYGESLLLISRYDVIMKDSKQPGSYLSLERQGDIYFSLPMTWQSYTTLYLDSSSIMVSCLLSNETNTPVYGDVRVSTGGHRKGPMMRESIALMAEPMTESAPENKDVNVWYLGKLTLPGGSKLLRILEYGKVEVKKIYWHELGGNIVTYRFRLTGADVLVPGGVVDVLDGDSILGSDTVKETLLRDGNFLDVHMGRTPMIQCVSSVQIGDKHVMLRARTRNETEDPLYLAWNPHGKLIVSSTVAYGLDENGALVFETKGSQDFECILEYSAPQQ